MQSHTCPPEMNADLEAGRGTQPAYDGITGEVCLETKTI